MAEIEARHGPALLGDRPRAAQAGAAIAVPVALGVLCGWLLGVSRVGYTIVTLLLILGGIAAGYEHRSPRGGALRGALGGVLVGGAIAVTHAAIGGDARAGVPHPTILIALLFGAIGAVLGIGGAALRRRHEHRQASA